MLQLGRLLEEQLGRTPGAVLPHVRREAGVGGVREQLGEDRDEGLGAELGE
ncbi:hypothetical protein [Streptomyces venezuelae]|uniref:hypothetical protein n=1 Tax=Streptomyces venezuelae TaxID=54571 RepID=UPI001F48E449|nr:hypothetical protein [Streptomyces venezuelae]